MIAPLSPKGDFGFVETDSRSAIFITPQAPFVSRQQVRDVTNRAFGGYQI